MANQITMDGRELFLQFAEKVLRGEVLITHMVTNLSYERPGSYNVRVGAAVWPPQEAKLDMTLTVEDDILGLEPPPLMVTVPVQVRELIFDEPPRPIYDADLVDEK